MAGPTRDLILGALGALGALAFFAAGMADASAAGSRGLTIRPRGAVLPSGPELRLYGDSRALVIGIDDYTHGWPRLKMAVADARAVARELERRGFDVTLKLNLDSADLSRTLKEFFAIQGAEPEARLFLWFAGHGQTIGGEGFLVPADAPLAADPAFKVKALHMRDFGGLVRLAEAKHVLSIFDSCFSGTIFRARAAAAPAAIGAKTAKPVRQFLTSGDAGQEVRDDGSFRELFLRAIRGEARADANTDGYVTGDELGLFLSQSMAGLTDAAQTPRWGRLQDVRVNQGDLVFEAGGRPPRRRPSAIRSRLRFGTRSRRATTPPIWRPISRSFRAAFSPSWPEIGWLASRRARLRLPLSLRRRRPSWRSKTSTFGRRPRSKAAILALPSEMRGWSSRAA